MNKYLMDVTEIERQRLVQRSREQLHEIEQLFIDAAAWNDNSQARKNGAEPIDPDPGGTMLKLRDALRALIARESAREAQRFAQ